MKKFLTILSAVCLLTGLAGCAEKADPEPEASAATETEKEEQKKLVVFFSATGTTKGIAERIASIENADLYEILPAFPYTSEDLDWHDASSRTSVECSDPESRPEITGDSFDPDLYEVIYIGYPIWWGDIPPVMRTFMERYEFTNQTIIPFCTSGSSPIGSSDDHLKEFSSGGNWKKGRRISADISDSELQEWIDSLK